MSAIGSGITVISGSQLDASIPVVLTTGQVLTFSHFVGKKAWQIICSDAQGNIITGWGIVQVLSGVFGTADTIALTTPAPGGSYFISIRWQENSTETSMIPVDSASVVITPPPG